MKILDWAREHRLLTAGIIIWAMWLVTVVTLLTFINPPEIPGSTAAALATVYGLPALAIGLAKWRHKKDTSDADT